MPTKKIVAIHQPTFFPWLGFFDKIVRSDVFILMDNVQFPKKGGNWINRVQLAINNKAAWVTMPVIRSFHGTRTIKEMEINNSMPWRENLLGTIQMNYAKAPFFKQVFPFLKDLIENPTDSLAEYNENAIRVIATAIELDISKIIYGSTLNAAGSATDLVINMTREVGGNAYLAGGGAGGYQEDDKFAASGVELIYQDFNHPVYPQSNTTDFIPGLSIIDTLMNIGFIGVKGIFADISNNSR